MLICKVDIKLLSIRNYLNCFGIRLCVSYDVVNHSCHMRLTLTTNYISLWSQQLELINSTSLRDCSGFLNTKHKNIFFLYKLPLIKYKWLQQIKRQEKKISICHVSKTSRIEKNVTCLSYGLFSEKLQKMETDNHEKNSTDRSKPLTLRLTSAARITELEEVQKLSTILSKNLYPQRNWGLVTLSMSPRAR